MRAREYRRAWGAIAIGALAVVVVVSLIAWYASTIKRPPKPKAVPNEAWVGVVVGVMWGYTLGSGRDDPNAEAVAAALDRLTERLNDDARERRVR